MELTKINKRHYLVLNEKLKIMIPFKYEEVVNQLKLSDFDFKKIRLSKEERFKLEFELLIHTIEINEPLVFELIQNQKFSKISSPN